ncbi:MAG TPA: hypothetical protein VN688_00805 [Gemmataceae bacterium]|nr:hypothetical protein [Gemmataceae bacterium]
MKNLAELQAECAALGITVETNGRASKQAYLDALRDYHWRKDHPDEPLPLQIQPMLLASWEDLDEDEARQIEEDCHAWVAQEKFDGVRVLIHVEDGRVRITGRTISEVSYRLTEHQENLPHLTTGLSTLTGTILDGELICPVSCVDTGSTVTATSLQATVAVLATTPANARQIQEHHDAQLRLKVFDILSFCGRDVTQRPLIERQDFLEKALRQSDNPFIEPVPSFVVNKPDIHRRIISRGREGTVWKKANSIYLPGRRVPFWVKRKRGIEVEAFVTAGKAGNNGHAQVIGAVEFSIRNPDGTRVAVAWVSGWSDEERQAMTVRDTDGVVRLNPDFIGRRAVLVGQDESAKSRRIRHARLKQWVAS